VRTIAVDWSGRVSNAAKTIWVAEVADGELVFLENGRDRAGVARILIEWAAISSDLVVGFDFAFSFPEWFLAEQGWVSAHDLWERAASQADEWLVACEPPFWGRRGAKRPDLGGDAHFRVTDQAVPSVAGIRPKSVFQIGGAGAVGTGSIRGMAILSRLSAAGFSIWPFDPPGRPLVIEIYPRLLTGPVRKSYSQDRETYVLSSGLRGGDVLLSRAAVTEDAFDAAISAFVMWEHRAEISQLQYQSDKVSRLEGSIWYPGSRATFRGPSEKPV
jgi:hypothetical protein